MHVFMAYTDAVPRTIEGQFQKKVAHIMKLHFDTSQ